MNPDSNAEGFGIHCGTSRKSWVSSIFSYPMFSALSKREIIILATIYLLNLMSVYAFHFNKSSIFFSLLKELKENEQALQS